MHHIWQSGLFLQLPQQTTDGSRLEVLSVGTHNFDAGPDFSAAKVRINGVTWSGNVEIHVRASDWYRHGHHTDAAYDSVVLHVVKVADKKVYNSKGELIPQCELAYPDDPDYIARMLADTNSLCEQRLYENPDLLTKGWKTALLNDRMRRKTDAVRQLLALSHNNWEEAFYVTLAHNFGFHTNGLPFELLAKQTPLPYLLKHRNSLFQIEAMLFGQASLLEPDSSDEYVSRLAREYSFLRKKFSLEPLQPGLWKMLRMRPQNFPHVRIAQFAALLHERDGLFNRCLETSDISALRRLFQMSVSDYWRTHYRFGGKETEEPELGGMGKTAADTLIINTIVPYKFAWGETHGSLRLRDEAFDILRLLPAENNSVMRQWRLLGVKPQNAAESQALLHLHQEYCIRKRCLDCEAGYGIFTPK